MPASTKSNTYLTFETLRNTINKTISIQSKVYLAEVTCQITSKIKMSIKVRRIQFYTQSQMKTMTTKVKVHLTQADSGRRNLA